jgi:16S rRNA (guanine966-N2)-methyltransferase
MGVGEQRMRIIAGKYRGRRIKSPKGQGTRPTTDRVRESLFSALASISGPDVGGGAALDLFAGSGALGLEALSRGCERATLVESHRAALSALQDNVAALDVGDRVRILRGDAFALAAHGIGGGPFALILLDPPYTLDQTAVARMLESLAVAGAIESGALVTWEHAAGSVMPWPPRFALQQRRKYGSTEVDIAVHEGSDGSQ